MDRDQDTKRIKRLVKQVNIVLTEQWDPIGINDEEPEIAYSEYHSYAPKIAGMIYNGADVDQIAEHLNYIQSEWMGLGGKSSVDHKTAELLIALWDR